MHEQLIQHLFWIQSITDIRWTL